MTAETGPSDEPLSLSRRPLVVVVTGLSGAGRTTALHALEDLGFFCIDNLPTVLAAEAVRLCEHGGMSRVALGIDVRVRAFLGDFENVLSLLDDGGRREVQVIFLDAADEAILRRFSETRRPHALATADSTSALSVLEGVAEERARLAPLRARATRILDTTRSSVHELRKTIVAHFVPKGGSADRMRVRFVSFGFKYGTPVDVDLLLDVRFLKNPYFVEGMREKTGLDPDVASFVKGLPETPEFLARTLDLLEFVVPMYEREGKAYLTIGVGCTGGRHRSVAISQELASRMVGSVEAGLAAEVAVVHRDIDRDGAQPRERKSVLPPSPAQTTDRQGGGQT
ncbi:MAG: RNase adapter RapZ [Myxococcales bacterium]|nr:RNase adapter RapZ [Myxococcales bacterium]